jgi:class 3 adenylate cyclase/outer membrane protein assembly factor BamB
VPDRRIATVVMIDIVGSAQVAAQLGDARYRELSSRFARMVRARLRRAGGHEEDHAGDGFFLTFPQPDRAIRFAADLANGVRDLGIDIRTGVHTGQTESQAGKTQGIAVVIGARVMSLAGPGEILVTSTTKELVTGSDFGFEDFSAHELKGVPGTWQVFAITSVDGVERARPLPADEAARRLGDIRQGEERPRRTALVVSGAAVTVVAVIVLVLVARGDGTSPTPKHTEGLPSGAVVQLDPATGEQSAVIPASAEAQNIASSALPVTNHAMTIGEGGIWVAWVPRFLVHVDPLDRDVRARLELEPGAFSFSLNVAVGEGAVWVSNQQGLIKVNPATDEQRSVVPLITNATTVDVAFGAGSVWMGTGDGRLLRLDPRTERERWVEHLDPIDSLSVGFDAVWTTDVLGSAITGYDPDSLEVVHTFEVQGGVDALVVGDEKLWALSRSLGSLAEIDPAIGTTGRNVQVGETPTVIGAGLGAIWVADRDGTIRRIDQATRQVTVLTKIDGEPRALAVDEDTETLWVNVT